MGEWDEGWREKLRKDEIETIKLYLTDLLKIEENKYFQDNTEKIYYLTHKIPLVAYHFTADNEPFYILLQVDNYAIYFNDIEECFGICKIDNNECDKAAEFFDYLAPTVRKFKKAYEEENIDLLLK